VTGTWLQGTAQAWLVLRLTASALALGLVSAFQFLPTLLFGLFGGVLADRFDKRRLLVLTQGAFAVCAAALGALTAAGAVRLWQVDLLALASGMVTAVDAPARQAFVAELVDRGELPNAVALNSSVFNSARAAGPAAAGALIAGLGLAACFYLNALSYLAVIGGLLLMRPGRLRRTRVPREPVLPALRSALAHIRASPVMTLVLGMLAMVGTFGMNLQVLVPVLAREELRVGAVGFGVLSSAGGVGALLGALGMASAGRASLAMVLGGALAFGVLQLGLALPVGYAGAAGLLLLAGGASIVYTSASQSLLQLHVADPLRGRVMAVYFLLFAGTTPVGAPAVGAVAARFGTRGGFLAEGAVTVAAAVYGLLKSRRPRGAVRAGGPGPR
jgi:MFS family permease